MLGHTVHMALATDRLFPEASRRIGHNSEKEHPVLKFLAILRLTHIHHDGVDGVGSLAGGVEQALADGIQTSVLGFRTEYFRSQFETHRVIPDANIQTGIEFYAFVRT